MAATSSPRLGTAAAAAGYSELLAHSANDSDMIYPVFLRNIIRDVYLGSKKDQPLAVDCIIKRSDGSSPFHFEGKEHSWVYGESSERYQRQREQIVYNVFHVILL